MEQKTGDKNIDSISIVCDASQNAIFVFYEEFFKLCGIYVIKKPVYSFDDSDGTENYVPVNRLDITQDRKIEDREDGQKRLESAIEGTHYVSGVKRQLSELSKVYLNNNLMYCNAMERYFYAPTRERLEGCLAYFRGAVKELRGICENNICENGRYVKYFMTICQHKINVLLGKLRRKKEYDGLRLINKAIGLCAREKGYVQGYILAGNIADGDLNYLNYSIDFYSKALTGVSAIDAYIYYRRGRYYEKIEHDEARALKDYRKAYQFDRNNYRALFKVAFLEMNQGRYYMYVDDVYMRRAVMDFLEIRKIMYADILNRDLMPIQLEYLTKTYKKLYEIYDIWLEERYSAMRVLEKLCDLEQLVNSNEFFSDFFPKESAEKEKSLLKQYLHLDFYKEKMDIIEQDYIINERGKRTYVK